MKDVGMVGRTVFCTEAEDDEEDEGGTLLNWTDEEEDGGRDTGPAGGSLCCSADIPLFGTFLAGLGLGAGKSSSFSLFCAPTILTVLAGGELAPTVTVTVAWLSLRPCPCPLARTPPRPSTSAHDVGLMAVFCSGGPGSPAHRCLEVPRPGDAESQTHLFGSLRPCGCSMRCASVCRRVPGTGSLFLSTDRRTRTCFCPSQA